MHVSEYLCDYIQVLSLKLAEARSWLMFGVMGDTIFAGMCELRNDGSVRVNQISSFRPLVLKGQWLACVVESSDPQILHNTADA